MRKMQPRLFALMLKLADGSRSCHELAEETGLCRLTVYHYMKALHQSKLCHIGGWDKDAQGRACLKLYQMGPGIDQRPPKQDNAKRAREWRQRTAQVVMQNALAGRMAA